MPPFCLFLPTEERGGGGKEKNQHTHKAKQIVHTITPTSHLDVSGERGKGVIKAHKIKFLCFVAQFKLSSVVGASTLATATQTEY